MGEAKNTALRVNLDRRLRLEFHGARITSDAGALLLRELDGTFHLLSQEGSRSPYLLFSIPFCTPSLASYDSGCIRWLLEPNDCRGLSRKGPLAVHSSSGPSGPRVALKCSIEREPE